MLETIRNAFKIPDLRKKLLFTLFIIIIFRVGSAIPVPFLDATELQSWIGGNSGSILGYVNILSGGAFSQATIFALSISPYINASIIMQLLTVAIPALERLSKEGMDGRRKINKITRYVTLGLALVQSVGYYFILRNGSAQLGTSGALLDGYKDGFVGVFVAIVIVACFTAGTALIVWLGEQINDRGIGNGISVILFAGIISGGPSVIMYLWSLLELAVAGQTQYFFLVPLIIVLFLAIVAFIVLISNAERRIPVQYAKRVVGRKQYGGQSTHIPIKVNMSGVMPIIFASAILALPTTIQMFANIGTDNWFGQFLSWFNTDTPLYAILYFVLIIAFNYFYVAIQYNPVEIANNLRKNNGGIPGIRPGKPTSDFIQKVLSKIIFIGAICLGIIAILPIILQWTTGMNLALGGTSVLIIVGVALETVRTLESQMMMRHYKGFLD